jgi:hypothetical protein
LRIDHVGDDLLFELFFVIDENDDGGDEAAVFDDGLSDVFYLDCFFDNVVDPDVVWTGVPFESLFLEFGQV